MPFTTRLLRLASMGVLAAAAAATAFQPADEPAQLVFGQDAKAEPLAHPDGPSLSDLLATTRQVSVFAGYLRASNALEAALTMYR